MSATEGDGGGDEMETGISLLVSVDEQSLRSARADIEDALTDSVTVGVDVDVSEPDVDVAQPDPVDVPVSEPDVGALDRLAPEDVGRVTDGGPSAAVPETPALDAPTVPETPSLESPSVPETSATPDSPDSPAAPSIPDSIGDGIPDALPEDIARAQAEQGLSPNRERRFARREHRWARQRTKDQEDLLTAVRDIEDTLDEDFVSGGGLFGGIFDGLTDVFGDAAGAGALTGAAAALTGAAKALVGAAVALGGGAVLDTVTDTLFGGDGSDSVELDDSEIESLQQLEGLTASLDELTTLQQETKQAIQELDVGSGDDGGDNGPFGFDIPDFIQNPPEFPDLPEFIENPPEFPDLPDWLSDGDGKNVTVTVAPNPLPVEPSPVGLTPTPVPVADTTLPVEDTTLPVETPTLAVEQPTLPVEQPTLPIEGPVGLTPTPVPVDPPSVLVEVDVVALNTDPPVGGPSGSGENGNSKSGEEDMDMVGPGVGGLIGDPRPKIRDIISDVRDSNGGVFVERPESEFQRPDSLPEQRVGDGVGGDNSGALGRLIDRQDTSETTSVQTSVGEPVVVEINADATATLGNINVTVNAAFDDLQNELDDVFAEIDSLKRELEQEISSVERELENETRDLRRQINRGLRG